MGSHTWRGRESAGVVDRERRLSRRPVGRPVLALRRFVAGMVDGVARVWQHVGLGGPRSSPTNRPPTIIPFG